MSTSLTVRLALAVWVSALAPFGNLSGQNTAIQPGTDTLTIWAVKGNDTVSVGYVIDQLRIVDTAGEWRFVRTYSTVSRLLPTRVDTIVDRVDGMAPVRAVTVRGDSTYRLRFEDDSLYGEFVNALGFRQPVNAQLPPHTTNGSSFDLVIRGSLLGIGDTVMVRAVNPSAFFGIRILAARVDGQEEIEGKMSWRVMSDFPNGIKATFWIDQRTRALVQQRLELSRGVQLLFNHQPPRGRVPVRSKT